MGWWSRYADRVKAESKRLDELGDDEDLEVSRLYDCPHHLVSLIVGGRRY